jgi:hypothetical protein
MMPRYTIKFEIPANGRLHKATAKVQDENGDTLFSDKQDMESVAGRQKLVNRVAKFLKKEPEAIQRLVDEAWFRSYSEWLAQREKPTDTPGTNGAPGVTPPTAEITDATPPAIRRPLCLVGGRAYAAAQLHVQVTETQGTDEKGQVVTYAPPRQRTETVLAIVRDDGRLYADCSVLLPNMLPRSMLQVPVELSAPLPPDSGWSGAGVKRFLAGERPNPADVLERVASVYDVFMDFSRSLASQQVMCELSACCVLATYFLDTFSVTGYLWPNGGSGSGKTNYLLTTAAMAYLGQVILAGGSYASLRDLAHYGANLCFDDAEAVMDVRKTDPDKRALLLAGNRRGAFVTVKELVGDRWELRYINAFCPRLFSAIRLPDDVLASRSIIIPLVRSDDSKRSKAVPTDYATWPCDRQRLVDDLWAAGLAYLAGLREYYDRAAAKARLSGRDLEPWRGILAVALWLDEAHGVPGLFDEMNNLSVAYQEERGDLESGDPTRVAIKALREMVQGQPGPTLKFSPKGLAEEMNRIAVEEDLAEDDNDKPYTNPRKVGWMLKRLRFHKVDRDRKSKLWETTPGEVETLARTYGVGSPEPGNVSQDTPGPENAESF